jgi:hypothetical protein
MLTEHNFDSCNDLAKVATRNHADNHSGLLTFGELACASVSDGQRAHIRSVNDKAQDPTIDSLVVHRHPLNVGLNSAGARRV